MKAVDMMSGFHFWKVFRLLSLESNHNHREHHESSGKEICKSAPLPALHLKMMDVWADTTHNLWTATSSLEGNNICFLHCCVSTCNEPVCILFVWSTRAHGRRIMYGTAILMQMSGSLCLYIYCINQWMSVLRNYLMYIFLSHVVFYQLDPSLNLQT